MSRMWKNLITPETITKELCVLSIEGAARGKTRDGSRPKIRKVMRNLDKYAGRLQRIMLDPVNKLHLHKYTHRAIHENRKARELDIPEFWPDQCVHHVLINLMKNRALKRVDPDAMACVDGRGTDYGVGKLKNWIRLRDKPGHKNHWGIDTNKLKTYESKYVMKADIYHCFPSLSTKVVYDEFSKFIADPLFMYCIKQVLNNSQTLPIGIAMSGWFFNLMMKPFDEVIRNYPGTTHYMRYMDDFVVFAKTRNELKKLRPIIDKELDKYGLRLKAGTQIYETSKHGVDLMGHRVKRNTVIRRKSSWKIVRHEMLQLERFLFENRVNLLVINDIVYTIKTLGTKFLVRLQSHLGACHLDNNAHIRRFMHTPGIGLLFKNATRMHTGHYPIDTGWHELTYFDTRLYERDMRKSATAGKKEVMQFINPIRPVILHNKEAEELKHMLRIDRYKKRKAKMYFSFQNERLRNLVRTDEEEAISEAKRKYEIRKRALVYSELDMYGYSREFVKIPHLLWVDQVAMENRAKNNR